MKKIIQGISIAFLMALGLWLSSNVSAQSSLLGMIDVTFCNNNQTKEELDLISKAGNKLPICVEFTNKSNASVSINAEFLDSIITDDSSKNRACNAADRPKTQFGNFMLPYSGELLLPSQQTIQKIYNVQYPIGFSGWSHGCLAYNVVGADIKNKSMFTIRIRSIKYLDVLISDTKPIQALLISQGPMIKKVGDEYQMSIGIHNKGNVSENIQINGAIFNIFGYTKDFSFDAIVPANTGIFLTTPSFILPGYGGAFLVKGTMTYTPEFNFNITNGKKPPQIYADGIKKIQTILFIWTRQSRITIGIIVLLIMGIFRIGRRRKQIIVN